VIQSLPTFPIRDSLGAVTTVYIIYAVYQRQRMEAANPSCQFSTQRKLNLIIIAQLCSHAPPTLNSAPLYLYKIDPGGLGLALVQI
jgi:hypothetical protein